MTAGDPSTYTTLPTLRLAGREVKGGSSRRITNSATAPRGPRSRPSRVARSTPRSNSSRSFPMAPRVMWTSSARSSRAPTSPPPPTGSTASTSRCTSAGRKERLEASSKLASGGLLVLSQDITSSAATPRSTYGRVLSALSQGENVSVSVSFAQYTSVAIGARARRSAAVCASTDTWSPNTSRSPTCAARWNRTTIR